MWTVVFQKCTVLSKSCVVCFYMLAFLMHMNGKGFMQMKLRTHVLTKKIVLANFVAKGLSPHLLLLPSKLRPASHHVAWTDFYLELLYDQTAQIIRQQNAAFLDWAHSGMLLTVKHKAKTKGQLVSRLLAWRALSYCCPLLTYINALFTFSSVFLILYTSVWLES